MTAPSLIDSFGRIHTNLRVSVTDRCNIRCTYCMPSDHVEFRPRHELLSFEEIHRFVRIAASCGIRKVRLTGGEPLLRSDLSHLVTMLAGIPELTDISMTTNGMLLADQAAELRRAGLHRLNVSLDTLDEGQFQQISRRSGLDRVLAGISAAIAAGFDRIRLNAIAIRGFTEREVVPLVTFARENRLELRFIEYMPLDAERRWEIADVLPGDEIRNQIEAEFGPLVPLDPGDASQPAKAYRFLDGRGVLGFINSVTQPFCGECNRLRLTAEGQVRNCLFSTEEWDARAILRAGLPAGTDDDLSQLLAACVAGKRAGHGIDTPHFMRPERAMYQIGG